MHEVQQTQNLAKNGTIIGPAMVGALVGASAALLLAPASGRDTRRKIGETAQRLGNGAKDVVKRTRATLDGIRQDAKSAIDGGRREYMRSRDERNVSTTF
jgi:gas vesicle protein